MCVGLERAPLRFPPLMSASSTPVSAQLFDYVAAHTRGEDAFLGELKAAARASGIPAIWISP